MVSDVFASIDRKDTAGFCAYLTEDCVFRFGNQPSVRGVGTIAAYIHGFFGSIAAIEHQLEAHWNVDSGIVVHGRVTYTRLDGSTLTVPFSNIFTLREGRISEYLIFVDNSALYQPPR